MNPCKNMSTCRKKGRTKKGRNEKRAKKLNFTRQGIIDCVFKSKRFNEVDSKIENRFDFYKLTYAGFLFCSILISWRLN